MSRLEFDFQSSHTTDTSDIGRIVSDCASDIRSSDNWATPRWLLALLSPRGDHFDPCPIGGTGGLEADWPTDRLVYVNPPFSNPLPWVRKAAAHAGPVTLLLPVDPTTKWWTYADGFEVILIGSRLHFNEAATYARQTLAVWRRLDFTASPKGGR